MRTKLPNIICPYGRRGECDLLRSKNPSSASYKSLVEIWCGTDDYVNCPVYTNLDKQIKEKETKKKESAHTPENFGKLEQYLSTILGDAEADENDGFGTD